MASLPPTFALEPAYKSQFADNLDAGFTPMIAALRLWPKDAGLSSQVARDWPSDPWIVAYRENKVAAAAKAAAETPKDKQIKRIESKLDFLRGDEYLKGERLLAELQGHLYKPEAPSVVVNNNNAHIDRVMIVKDFGTDEEWEKRVEEQQRKLIEHEG